MVSGTPVQDEDPTELVPPGVPEPDPSVTVGDKVWFDENGDGRQDPGEPGIPGLVLEIVGPDGEPVTDVHGNPVGPVTTDENGNYLFEDLPVLEEGQSYKVRIDREASSTALEGYLPTTPGVGDREGDSSTWEALTEGLTAGGESDLTLDFGFVLSDVTPEPTPDPTTDPEPDPTTDPEPTTDPSLAPSPDGELPSTGVDNAGLLVLITLVVLGLGAGLLATARRKQLS